MIDSGSVTRTVTKTSLSDRPNEISAAFTNVTHKESLEYGSIIEILKQKIYETDEMIRVKKAAKGEFAYALSKNLLKTISNLSLEVMSLNQVTLKDQQFDESATHNFMAQINSVIHDKLQRTRFVIVGVHEYRATLQEEHYEVADRENPDPNQQPSDKKKPTKGKKISFVDT